MNELLKRLRRCPRDTAVLLAASGAVNLLGLASSLYVMQVLGRYVAHGVTATLVTLTVGVVIALAGEFTFRSLRLRLAHEIAEKSGAGERDALFRAFLDGKLAAVEERSEAERLSLLQGVNGAEKTLGGQAIVALSDLPFSPLLLTVLLLLSWPVGVTAASFVIAGALYALWAAKRAQGNALQLRAALGEVEALTLSAVRSADAVRQFRLKPTIAERWTVLRGKLADLQNGLTLLQGRDQAVGQLLQALMGVGVIAVGADMAVQGLMDVGVVVGANIIAARALAPVARVMAMTEDMRKAMTALERARAFSALPREPEGGATLSPFKGGLALRGLAWRQDSSTLPLFLGVNADLAPGVVAAVTGRNGAGKSTLLRLTAGLLSPTDGAVLADGVDIRLLELDWWRTQISYLPQEPSFLDLSISDNLRLARPALTADDIASLLSAVGVDSYLRSRGANADLTLTKGGATLPVGVRRRLGLARALAVDAPLFLLDEPTDGLDRLGREQVYSLLIELARRGRTLVIATHDERILAGAGVVIDLDRFQGSGAV